MYSMCLMMRHFFFALMHVKCHFVFHHSHFFRQDKEFESWINNFHTNKTCTTTSDCPEDDSSTNQYHYKCDLVLNQCVCNGLSYYCNQSTTANSSNNDNANRKNYHNNDNQTFLSNNRLNDLVRRMPMLPISIVLISMFISICIVLQLFAKARFRNTQRSIFANPQKLELAKAQERRLSQLSQLSGQQQQQQQWSSDRGMIYSLNHHKYPRLSLPQAPISLSSSSMYNHRSVRNSLGSTNIVPTAMIGSTLTYPTPMFDNSITALSSSSSTSSSSSSKSSKNMMKQKQGTINVNLQ
uniref:Rho GTPase-activating protein gacU-like isoform X1 n=1 Tax=Dermatophagoides pteronyssinus TaxID=6956 RepID=A0A6P6XL71_DERPT|nr:rho GTPase-activating protein gacU-like isoform X1 [Dermatophagoides pteronyssinus]